MFIKYSNKKIKDKIKSISQNNSSYNSKMAEQKRGMLQKNKHFLNKPTNITQQKVIVSNSVLNKSTNSTANNANNNGIKGLDSEAREQKRLRLKRQLPSKALLSKSMLLNKPAFHGLLDSQELLDAQKFLTAQRLLNANWLERKFISLNFENNLRRKDVSGNTSTLSNYPTVTEGLELKWDSTQKHSYNIEGYASIYEVIDSHNDIVCKGAFEQSIETHKKENNIKLLWQHDPKEPIGVINEIFEDSKGLYIKGKILSNLKKGKEAAALVEEGAIKGLSIGFRVTDFDFDKNGARLIKKAELWEVSIVTFPANSMALISHLKSYSAMLIDATNKALFAIKKLNII